MPEMRLRVETDEKVPVSTGLDDEAAEGPVRMLLIAYIDAENLLRLIEGPASVPPRLAVNEKLHLANLTVGPDHKLALIDEMNLCSVTIFGGVPE